MSAWCVVPMGSRFAPLLSWGCGGLDRLWDHFLTIARLSRRTSSAEVTHDRDPRFRLSPEDRSRRGARRCATVGGRLQFAYAWFPATATDRGSLRCAICRAEGFRHVAPEIGTARAAKSRRHLPLLGWYEREMMDLNGIRFAGHPNPIRSSCATGRRHANGQDFREPAWTADIICRTSTPSDVQRLPFGPIRADVVESAEFTFFYVGEHILHYQPRLFFKHRGHGDVFRRPLARTTPSSWRSGSRRRNGRHALAYCEAVERAADCDVAGSGPRRCACCSRSSSASTTTCTTSATSATRRR